MCGYIWCDKIRNKVIREKVGMDSMADQMRETRLCQFEHVQSVSMRLLGGVRG